jgi:uncharacterized repeat protein (TIGR02543 family)
LDWFKDKGDPYTSYAVTFDLNGGGAVESAASDTKTGKVAKPADPTREGYTFDGWFTAASGGEAFDFDAVITAATTVYARWTVIAVVPEPLADGAYSIPVAAFHETNNSLSMMSPLLYADAYVEISDGDIEVTLYFIGGSIMGMGVSAADYYGISVYDNVPALSEVYNQGIDVRTVKISVESLDEFIPLKIGTNNAMGGASNKIRLKFTPDEAVADGAGLAYLIPSAAYHATNETLSMMAPMLYGEAYIELVGEKYAITFYIITAYVTPPMPGAQPVLAEASTITVNGYKDVGDEEFKPADFAEYDASIDVVVAKITISDLSADIHVSTSRGNFRLRLNVAEAEKTDAAPVFTSLQ